MGLAATVRRRPRRGWVSLRADLESSSKFALLATVNGTPASVARLALSESVVRLFGAVTLPAFRGRGLSAHSWRPAASSREPTAPPWR